LASAAASSAAGQTAEATESQPLQQILRRFDANVGQRSEEILFQGTVGTATAAFMASGLRLSRASTHRQVRSTTSWARGRLHTNFVLDGGHARLNWYVHRICGVTRPTGLEHHIAFVTGAPLDSGRRDHADVRSGTGPPRNRDVMGDPSLDEG
jgi:hypothetical protein